MLAIALAGCGDASEAQQLTAIRESVAKGDEKGAVVQLKTVLHANAQSGEARLLLGTLLLRRGDAVGAVVELERAVEAKQPEAAVLPVLAEALLASRQAKKVIERYGNTVLADSKAGVELKILVAMAHAVQGDDLGSAAAVKAALAMNPKNASARLMQARISGSGGAIDDALALVASVIVDEPRRADALQLKGDLLWQGKSDSDGALKAFRDVLAVAPSHVAAHSALLGLLLHKGDVGGFKSQIAELKKVAPNHPDTRFYDVQLALLEGNLARAREGSQQLLRMAPDSPLALQLAGGIEFRNGALQLAEVHLKKALKLSPNLPLATRLLADTHLRSGHSEKALALLQPLVDRPAAGAEELALAAQAHLQVGNLVKAEAYFSRAAKANPSDPKAKVALALTQLAKGDAGAGFDQLESLAAADKGTYADLALISARLQRNDTAAALKAVERLETKEPDKALPQLIRGRIALLRKDLAGARASFEKALEKDPAYYPAVEDLASIDVVQKKPDDARKRFEALLERQPSNPRALLAVAQLRQRGGDKPEQIEALLVSAVKLNPTEQATHAALVEHLLAQRRAKAAVAAAQEALAALPNNALLQDILGRAQLAAGDVQQAIQTFGKNAQAQPAATGPLLRLADAYFVRQDYAAAAQNLRRALAITPDLLAAHQGLILVALATKRIDDALGVARTVQKQRPTEATGHLMEAEVHLGQRKWDAASASFKAALVRNRATSSAIRLHALYLRAGSPADAELFAENWMREQARDAEFLFHLATVALERKDYPTAEARFRQVLAVQPNNGLTLNNLAWLIVQQGKDGAVPFAERANELLPNQPLVLDTLASALAGRKEFSQAVVWQQKAVSLAPETPNYRLGLAKLLIASGDRTNAKLELDRLASLGSKFGAQAEVENLLKGL